MKKVLIAKPNYRKFSPTGYQMLLDKGYDVVCTDLDRDYYLEELRHNLNIFSLEIFSFLYIMFFLYIFFYLTIKSCYL